MNKYLFCVTLIILGCSEKRIKKIQTVFESHHSDTEEFDGKVISVANFEKNGKLKEYKDCFSYSNETGIKDRDFWTDPDVGGIIFLMDGMPLDKAEYHFLYGSNWPVIYARYLKDELEGMNDGKDHFFKIVDDESLTRITYFKNYTEHDFFLYEDEKISEYSSGYNVVGPTELTIDGEYVLLTHYHRFQYDQQDRLTRVIRQAINSSIPNIELRFFYSKQLERIEAYRDGRLLNTRIFYYQDGLKIKAEILNAGNNTEYVVNYDYSFF